MGQKEKLIKEKVMNRGGWRKDYERSFEKMNDKMVCRSSQESLTAKPAFKKYDGRVPQPPKQSTKRKDDDAVRKSMQARAHSRSQVAD